EEAGDRLFTFTRLPPSQWRSARTTNAIERLHEEFKRRIKTQTVLPSAETAAMLFWALLASGQISMRKVDGWQTLATKPIDQPIDLETILSYYPENAPSKFQPNSGRYPSKIQFFTMYIPIFLRISVIARVAENCCGSAL